MMRIGIIGGSGLQALEGVESLEQTSVQTPFGDPSGSLHTARLASVEAVFLARHGQPHHIPPHAVNYRANLWALDTLNVDSVIAVNAVGGITDGMHPGRLVVPDQIIDYTSGRRQTFFDADHPGGLQEVKHIDFTDPYDEGLREVLLSAAGAEAADGGTYAATQGPRLETAAEIRRLERDGCDIVGMTGMPEAALARELEIPYACLALVVNWGAGIEGGGISFASVLAQMEEGMARVQQVLRAALDRLGATG